MKLKLFVVAATMAVLCAAALSGCVYNHTRADSGSAASVVGPTPASPTPDPLCTMRSLDLGAEDDATTIPRGSAVKLVLSAYGPQKELDGACLANIQPQPTYEVSEPCELEGGGFDAAVRAPASAAIGASCTATARAGGFEDKHRFTVVGP